MNVNGELWLIVGLLLGAGMVYAIGRGRPGDGVQDELARQRRLVAELVSPIGATLEKVGGTLGRLELDRRESLGAVRAQLSSLADTQECLRGETARLVTALRSPATRGRWGEMQLRRVVEMAGMVRHCDFVEQPTVSGEGGALRPDLIVRLPGDRQVVIDAKVPLQSLLDALQATDERERAMHVRAHARQVRAHIARLGAKDYTAQFTRSPEFVVLFLPAESFYSTALEEDPGLIQAGVDHGVLLVTPTTLIGLLHTVAYGWREERVADSAREVSELGRQLHARLGTLAEHFIRLGHRLDGAVGAYNDAVGSLEGRVLVTARRLSDHGAAAGGDELSAPATVDLLARRLQAPELVHAQAPLGAHEPPVGHGSDGVQGALAK